MMTDKITLDIPKQDASALAHFCNRISLERIEPFAMDYKEAFLMTESLIRLGLLLEKEGFSAK